MPIIDLCVGKSIDHSSFLEVPIANFSQSWIVNTDYSFILTYFLSILLLLPFPAIHVIHLGKLIEILLYYICKIKQDRNIIYGRIW